MHYHSLAKVKSPCPSEGLRPVSCYPSLQMNKCFTQPYQRCTAGTGALLPARTVRENTDPQSKGINSLVLTGDIQDHRSNLVFFYFNKTPPCILCVSFSCPHSPREHKMSFFFFFLHIWASAIMQMMAMYLPECPWTTAFSNYEDYVQCSEFAIQNDPLPRSRGNCCRQIRLTLNLYFCSFFLSETFGGLVCII